jgi:hypothetical protein
VNAHTLLAQEVDEQGRGTVVLADASGVHGLVGLVALHVLDVHVEEVGGVHWAALGFGVELGGEDGARLVDHAFKSVKEGKERVGGGGGGTNLHWSRRLG